MQSRILLHNLASKFSYILLICSEHSVVNMLKELIRIYIYILIYVCILCVHVYVHVSVYLYMHIHIHMEGRYLC